VIVVVVSARARKGGVASTIHLATLAGVQVLEEGGNAFDAAIAVSSVLTALVPNTGDLGGDAFLIAKLESGEVVAYNGSGKSPRGFDAEAFLRERPKRGPQSVTVPGLVDQWGWVHENFCTMSMEKLLKPAITLLREGFYPQDPLLQAIERERKELLGIESWNRTYGSIRPGMLVRLREKAWVLEQIARHGPREFYEGGVAERVVSELRAQGVPVDLDDFKSHSGERAKPLAAVVEGFQVYELPPNTQGHTTLQILKTYETLENIKKREWSDSKRIERYFEIVAEAYRYRDENLADPRFMVKSESELLSDLILRGGSRGAVHSERPAEGCSCDTTFFVVADRHGNMIGFIQSLFYHFGSGVVASEILFQDRAYGFAKGRGVPNEPAPDKRPLHTLSILLAEGEGGTYIIGCAGGDLRPQIHTNVFINILYYNESLQNAVAMPRYILTDWDGYRPRKAILELGLNASIGGEVVVERQLPSSSTGIVHALHRRCDGEVILVADPRASGVALPYF